MLDDFRRDLHSARTGPVMRLIHIVAAVTLLKLVARKLNELHLWITDDMEATAS
jgi:hypothetical protein